MIYPNGDQYIGEYAIGARNGKGVYTWASGDKYDGIWKNDKMHGDGKYTYEDGCTAEGQFSDNEFVKGLYKYILAIAVIVVTQILTVAIAVMLVILLIRMEHLIQTLYIVRKEM